MLVICFYLTKENPLISDEIIVVPWRKMPLPPETVASLKSKRPHWSGFGPPFPTAPQLSTGNLFQWPHLQIRFPSFLLGTCQTL